MEDAELVVLQEEVRGRAEVAELLLRVLVQHHGGFALEALQVEDLQVAAVEAESLRVQVLQAHAAV